MATLRYAVTPNVKVKQTKSDTWRTPPRPSVAKFRAFRDIVQALGVTVQDGDDITFVLPMAASWSAKKRVAQLGELHRQKPDLDNLLGGLFDGALPLGDEQIGELGGVRKRWGLVGEIVIERKELLSKP